MCVMYTQIVKCKQNNYYNLENTTVDQRIWKKIKGSYKLFILPVLTVFTVDDYMELSCMKISPMQYEGMWHSPSSL